MKRCTHCGVVKPLEDFTPNASRTDGRQSWCKDCASENKRLRRAAPGGLDYDRAWTRARQRALAELARQHPEEYEAILTQEKIAEGLSPIRWDRSGR